MTDSLNFGQSYVQTVKDLIDAIEAAQLMQDRLNSEPVLAANAADAMAGAGRADMTEQVITDAAEAIGQIFFTFNSGSPTQKSLLYLVL
jgi:hypothetical protein